ncbi:MAG: DNA-3-methyladenine glycosylase II [Parcubacteria group bacterium Gr01-1014_30]|nr:MAG: DNA-3-methyladenine glycosylase II [Parcubacteria group bacterium Gr01-1014_30]
MSEKRSLVLRHFRKVDSVIYEALKGINFKERSLLKKRASSDYLAALCREVINQQLSDKVARVIVARFDKTFGLKVKPRGLLGTSDKKLRALGISNAKVSYIKNIGRAFLQKPKHFSRLHKLPDEEVVTKLTSIKGVGPWTAEMFLIFTLGREDVFSYGDLGLRKAFANLYGVKNPKERDLEKVVSRWSPFKSYGAMALWRSVDNA